MLYAIATKYLHIFKDLIILVYGCCAIVRVEFRNVKYDGHLIAGYCLFWLLSLMLFFLRKNTSALLSNAINLDLEEKSSPSAILSIHKSFK